MYSLGAFILCVAGSINWLCISLFKFDVIAGIFGSQSNPISRIIYGIIGLSSVLLIYLAVKNNGNINLTNKSENLKSLLNLRNAKIAKEKTSIESSKETLHKKQINKPKTTKSTTTKKTNKKS